jgi:putative endonuclease
MYFVYILQSLKDDSCYIGQCEDIKDRLNRHNQGRNKYTKTKTPWKLVYLEQYSSRSDAVMRETEIKKKKSRIYINWLISNHK